MLKVWMQVVIYGISERVHRLNLVSAHALNMLALELGFKSPIRTEPVPTEMTRDGSFILGFSVFGVECILPGNVNPIVRQLAVRDCREEHEGHIGLGSGEKMLDEEPAKFIIDRE